MSTNEIRDFVFKVVVVGDASVGKTSLIRRYTQGEFSDKYLATLGAQFTKFNTKTDETSCSLILWDIAGQDIYSKLRINFFQGSNAAIIVFSQENNEHGIKSIDHVKKWHDDIKKYCGLLPIILFGNKSDLVDNNTLEQNRKKAERIRNQYGFLDYYSTSALTGDGVISSFNLLIKKLLELKNV